jgi:membrane associated rhomboid family serine protease
MFRSRGENLRSTYVLLFLNIAFFLLQFQDNAKFTRLFGFDRDAVAAGEIWRLFTYQFAQAGHLGLFTIPPVLTLFLNLVLLSLMGFAVEAEWGTGHFLRFYLMSTLATALVAAWFNTPLLGSFFINFTLLFVYAALNRDQTFSLSTILPIRITFLAWLALAALLTGVFFGSKANLAALAGAAVGFGYYISQRIRVLALVTTGVGGAVKVESDDRAVITATRNVTRVTAVKRAIETRSISDIDRLIKLAEKEIVSGINICSPGDFKPEHSDRYCVRCEGFAECTVRHLRMNRPNAPVPATASASIEQAGAVT